MKRTLKIGKALYDREVSLCENRVLLIALCHLLKSLFLWEKHQGSFLTDYRQALSLLESFIFLVSTPLTTQEG